MSLFKSVLKPVYEILPPSAKGKILWITVLMVVQALLDFVNIGIFIPLFGMIADPGLISKLQWVPFDLSTTSFTELVGVFTIGILLFSVLKHFISVRITHIKTRFAYHVAQEISLRVLSEELAMSYEEFVKVDFGKEIDRMAHEPVAFATNIVLALATLISEGLIALLIVTGIAMYNYQLLVSLVVILLPVAYSYTLSRKKIKKINADLKSNHPELLKSSLAPLEGWLEIKTSQVEAFFKSRFQKIQGTLMEVFADESAIQTNVVRMTELFASVIICFIIFWSLAFHADYKQTLMLLVVYAGASFRLLPSINRILNSLVQIRSHQFVVDDLKPRQRRAVKEVGKNERSFQKLISLKSISFSYRDREPLFKNVNLDIRKGEKVAIVGKSGSGKSSLLLIILGILKPEKGHILLDENEISDKNYSVYQTLFSYVSQNPYLMDGTIRENIAFGVSQDEIDVGRVEKALGQVGLTDFINQLPAKDNTPIFEKGIALSGGQRQRIALARAIYSNREILILDEVTNQLDADTESKVIETLRKIATQGRTILMVTHHRELLPLFDRIIEIENGELV